MKLGIYAFSALSGLGNQSYDYFKFLKPTKTLLIDISSIDNKAIDIERFTNNPIGEIQVVKGYPSASDIHKFLDGLDVILIPETPLHHYVFQAARERGIKSILHANVEFIDYFDGKYKHWAKPDIIWLPTKWHYQEMKYVTRSWGCKLDFVPLPIDRTKFQFKLHTKAHNFLHIEGHRTAQDRNGTDIVKEAIRLVRNQDIRFTIRTQNAEIRGMVDRRVTVIHDNVQQSRDLFNDEDILLLPRRYAGLSLQKNEAMSLGIPVIMPNISPNYYDLPYECLIQSRLESIMPSRTPIGVYNIHPQDLADRIDWLAEQDISNLSLQMDKIADKLSWNNLLPLYESKLYA